MPSQVRGSYFYLYLFVDLFSRKAVGWQVFDCESAELASELLVDICRKAVPTLCGIVVNVNPDRGNRVLGLSCRTLWGDERLEELADMLEVIRALAKTENCTLPQLIALADAKAAQRGAFDERIFLEKVIPAE